MPVQMWGEPSGQRSEECCSEGRPAERGEMEAFLSPVSEAFGEDLGELSHPLQCHDLPPASSKYGVATTASRK